tara:strand:- start:7326 stop:7679 length:354 start_codon:yes stop_codon:yes gene_type:complete
MEDKVTREVENIKDPTTLIEIVYNDSSDLKKLATREEFRNFIIEDSLKTIEEAINNNLVKVELFNIYNLSLVIELERKNFKNVLNNIIKHYVEIEDYETCDYIKKLINDIQSLSKKK